MLANQPVDTVFQGGDSAYSSALNHPNGTSMYEEEMYAFEDRWQGMTYTDGLVEYQFSVTTDNAQLANDLDVLLFSMAKNANTENHRAVMADFSSALMAAIIDFNDGENNAAWINASDVSIIAVSKPAVEVLSKAPTPSPGGPAAELSFELTMAGQTVVGFDEHKQLSLKELIATAVNVDISAIELTISELRQDSERRRLATGTGVRVEVTITLPAGSQDEAQTKLSASDFDAKLCTAAFRIGLITSVGGMAVDASTRLDQPHKDVSQMEYAMAIDPCAENLSGCETSTAACMLLPGVNGTSVLDAMRNYQCSCLPGLVPDSDSASFKACKAPAPTSMPTPVPTVLVYDYVGASTVGLTGCVILLLPSTSQLLHLMLSLDERCRKRPSETTCLPV
jgi:hypothetical protein